MQTLGSILANNLLAVTLGALCVVEIFSLVPSPDMKTAFQESQPVLRISEIEGPRIGDGAAMVVVRSGFVPPVELFIFLFAVYVALLIFNFSYTFETATTPQWRLEGLITLSALFGWYFLDADRIFFWFPFAVLKSGLILFACYVYLLEKKRATVPKELAGA